MQCPSTRWQESDAGLSASSATDEAVSVRKTRRFRSDVMLTQARSDEFPAFLRFIRGLTLHRSYQTSAGGPGIFRPMLILRASHC
jgi:hypothetical protein